MTIDVLALRCVGNTTPCTQQLYGEGDTGEACTGILKLAQRWLVEFLTVRGSMPYLPLRGSDFMLRLGRGMVRTNLDLEQAFYLAAKQTAANMALEDSPTDPADERLEAAQLVSANLSGDRVTLSVQLTSAAGTSRTIVVPVTVQPILLHG